MNDKQKIKAKIGKLKSEYNKESDFRTVRGDTAREVLDKILSFIDTITEEHDEDLEEEFHRFLDEEEGVPRMWHSDEQMEWGKDIAHHFANWQKQQLMKDALNCSIIMHPNDRFANYSVSAYVPPLHPASTYISNGEKIKIIIIKEEEK